MTADNLSKASIYKMKTVIDIIKLMNKQQLQKTVEFCKERLEDDNKG